jgi:hypothetical protein
MTSKVDIEGEQYMRQLRMEALAALRWWFLAMEEVDMAGMLLLSFTVQSPQFTGRDYRGILKGQDEQGRRWVAFVNGESPQAVLAAAKREAEKRGLPWKEDIPYEERVARKQAEADRGA